MVNSYQHIYEVIGPEEGGSFFFESQLFSKRDTAEEYLRTDYDVHDDLDFMVNDCHFYYLHTVCHTDGNTYREDWRNQIVDEVESLRRDERKYGSYEDQVRSYYNSTRL